MEFSIDYVAAQPGFGKTRAAINYMKEHIMRGFDGENVGYIVYVAPTRALLLQTCDNLFKELDGKYNFMIHLKCSDRQRSGSMNVVREIEALLNDKQTSTRQISPFCQGSVLFITHSAFLRLRKHPKFEQTTVIFDEARKWVQLVESVPMNAEAHELFDKLFETRPLIVRDEKVEKFMTLHPRNIPHNQLAKLVRKKGASKAFGQLENMFTQLTPRFEGDIVRTQMFGTIQGEGEKTILIKIGLPSHPFRGFKKALILSADFTTSQMYHLLKWEKCHLNDVTERFMNRYSPEGYAEARERIEARLAQLTIVPLLYSDKMPSKNQFDSGVILPKKYLVEMKQSLREAHTSTRGLRDIVLHLRNPLRFPAILTTDQARLVRKMRELNCSTDALKWMLEMSDRLLRAWWKKNPAVRRETAMGEMLNTRGVLILNNDFSDDYKRYVEDTGFELLSIGKVEGRNDFRDANVVAFLAAINPEPQLCNLLKALLENYEVEEDYVVDKAIQAIGRGNIRNHKSTKKMLAIVSTSELAKRIWKRMGGKPCLAEDVTQKLGDYTFWQLNAATKAETTPEQRLEKERARQRAKQVRFRQNEVNRRLQTLRNKRSYYRSRLSLAPDATEKTKIETNISAIDCEIKKLIAFRKEQKKDSSK